LANDQCEHTHHWFDAQVAPREETNRVLDTPVRHAKERQHMAFFHTQETEIVEQLEDVYHIEDFGTFAFQQR
jgi:hypothetical protein